MRRELRVHLETAGQQSLFEDPPTIDAGVEVENPLPPGRAEAAPVDVDDNERADIITKDPIALSDVPVAADEHVRQIPVTTTDKDGRKRLEVRDGKILYRIAPHPTYVQVGDHVVRRDECSASDLASAKPVMVPQVTTVLYERGVIQHDHIDVMHALLHLMYDRYVSSGVASERVTTTKIEIAKILGVSHNGHLSKNVDEALQTLSGLRMLKSYQMPQPGQPGYGQINSSEVLMMGAIIINSRVEQFAGGSGVRGGRRPDVIAVDLNPAFVNAMCGDTKERMYLLTSLNLTQNLKHSIHWKRQLHRTLNARIGNLGRFQMPLYEIWNSCLGGANRDLDPEHPARWRKVRWKILNALREWEETGYLEKVEPFTRIASEQAQDLAQETVINVDSTSHVTVPAFNSMVFKGGVVEWVYCEAGPNFLSGRPQNRPSFARELLRATVDDDRQAERLLKELGVDFVVDTAFRRMKKFLTLLGERSNRMKAVDWLQRDYPSPSRHDLVSTALVERNRRQQMTANGQQQNDDHFQAPHADRRQRVIMAKVVKIMVEVDLQGMSERQEKSDNRLVAIALECYGLALNKIISERRESRNILNAEFRQVNPDKEKVFLQVTQAAAEIAWRASGLAIWYEKIATVMKSSGKYPTYGQKLPPELSGKIARRFPEANAMVFEMSHQTKNLWELELASVYRQRLVERFAEEEKLDEHDPAGRVEFPAKGK